MAGIDISQAHSLSKDKARKAVEDVAKKLAERFDVEYAWVGDRLDFKRSGVDGSIDVSPSDVRVTAKLGFLLSAMQTTGEKEIRKVLAEKFG